MHLLFSQNHHFKQFFNDEPSLRVNVLMDKETKHVRCDIL